MILADGQEWVFIFRVVKEINNNKQDNSKLASNHTNQENLGWMIGSDLVKLKLPKDSKIAID